MEIGSGTGVVSLLLMQRGMKQGYAMDIQAAAAQLSELNFKKSPWYNLLYAQHGDFLNTEPVQTVDTLLCNPPYIKKSLKPVKNHLLDARHRDAFNLPDFFIQSAKWMKADAGMHLIIPFSDRKEWIHEAVIQGLFPVYETSICSIEGEKPVRSLLEFKKKPEPTGFRTFILRDQSTQLTGEYRSLLCSVFLQEPV